MSERTMLVTLRIKVTDLPDEFRAKYAADMDLTADGLPTVQDENASTLARLLAETVRSEGGQDMIWEGSDHYVNFTDADVVSAKWDE